MKKYAILLFGLSLSAQANVTVTQLSSGPEPEHEITFRVTSTAVAHNPGNYVLVARALPSAGECAAQFVPLASLNGSACATGSACQTLGHAITDPRGEAIFYAVPFQNGATAEVSLKTDELCWSTATQSPQGTSTPIVAAGCSVNPEHSSPTGYVQFRDIELGFAVFTRAASALDAPLTGSPVDTSETLTIAP